MELVTHHYTHNGRRLCCRRSVSSVCVVGRHLVDFLKYCRIKFTNQRTVQVISANQSDVAIYGYVSEESDGLVKQVNAIIASSFDGHRNRGWLEAA